MRLHEMFVWMCALLLVVDVSCSCDTGNCTVANDTAVGHNSYSFYVRTCFQTHQRYASTSRYFLISYWKAQGGHVVVTSGQPQTGENVPENIPTTVSPSIFVTLPPAGGQMARARAINFTVDEPHIENGILTNRSNSSKHEVIDLSDVSMDDDEDEQVNQEQSAGLNLSTCIKGGLTYSDGERIEDGCESVCTCSKGHMDCRDRCVGAYFRRGKKIEDPLCTEKPVDSDPCCSLLVCAADTETEPLEMCTHNNKTYRRGEHFQDGCTQVCTCEAAGRLACKPRCAHPANTTAPTDRCVEVPDPTDSCCTKMLCDVSSADEEEISHRDVPKLKLVSAKYVNASTIAVKLDGKPDERSAPPGVELSRDRMLWSSHKLMPGGYVLAPGLDARFARLENTDDYVMVQNAELNVKSGSKKEDPAKASCMHNGETRKLGEEFYNGCEAFCVCLETGVKCLKIECPTYFGLDVVEPACVEWETVPEDFVPRAPHCCPESVRCKSNGTCLHEGVTYQNWQELPANVTGCEKHCYCEVGRVECQSACPPVPATPPASLPCAPHRAALAHLPEDDCCVAWTCSAPPGNDDKTAKKTDKHRLDGLNNRTLTKKPIPTPPVPGFAGPLLIYENEAAPTKPAGKPAYPDLQKAPVPSKPVTPDLVRPSPTKPKKGSKPASAANQVGVGPLSARPQFTSVQHPEEILQLISQHPELASYPAGSVFEVHSYPTDGPSSHFGRFQPPAGGAPPPPALPPGAGAGAGLNQLLLKHAQRGGQTAHGPPFASFPQSPVFAPTGLQYPMLNRPQSSPTAGFGGFPTSRFPGGPGFQQSPDEITVQQVEAVDGQTVRLLFSVSPLLVGLHGRVEVRYTDGSDDNIANWRLQEFTPPEELIATQQLEFDLIGLRPDTEYKVKVTVMLRDLHNTPTSQVYRVRTPAAPAISTMPPMIPIQPDLAVIDVNSTRATVVWRKLTEFELQFVDGVQLRYKELIGKVYSATPLIHRAVTRHQLVNLKPDTEYELRIFFIPFAGQTTELHADNMINFNTASEPDPYGFNVTLEVQLVKATTVEVGWSGVPYPEDKYVNIYRTIYQSDSGKGDFSTFKIAKRDSPKKTTIVDLKPGTRYRLWLEVYLTNGKIKTSNVQDFVTKPRTAQSLGSATQQGKLSSAAEITDRSNDYYGPLVIVAILAAIAIVSTLILLMILLKRHSQNKAPISAPARVSQAAYDNPTYKVEIQQETMGL